MKKWLLFLMPLFLLASCDSSSPKTYRFQDLAFDYPSSYKVEKEDIDGDRCELWLLKDGDNFMYIDLQKWDSEMLSQMTEEELFEGLCEDAYNVYAADLEDEEMDFDDDETSVEMDDNSVIMAYGGTHSGDPFLCVITNKLLKNYEVTTRSEAMDKETLEEMSSIMKSIHIEPQN